MSLAGLSGLPEPMGDAPDFRLPAIADAPAFGAVVPPLVADTHPRAGERVLENFAAAVRNANTRAAYMNAVADFLGFEPVAQLSSLAEVRSIYVSLLKATRSGRFCPTIRKSRSASL